MKYKTLEILQLHNAQLIDTVHIGSGIQMAAWSNQKDNVSVCSNHHTLSLYIRGGYESYRKTSTGWRNGGAPDRFCLMPQGLESTWDVRDHLSFVHLYYTDQHLKNIAVKIWDKEPSQIQLNEKDFIQDPLVSATYRHFLLNGQWQDQENQLQFSSAANLLLNHLIQNYSSVQWRLPYVSGGLAPHILRTVLEWIEQHLHLSISIADLAHQANLSEYHFAHMFKQSTGQSPHQYVLHTRLKKAHELILNSHLELIEIALSCGFSSASHFSTRFKHHFGYIPSQLRK
ncbi:AraC family transcriptional regulator [Acinetobacter wuhouensis]|uniref:helix-turn-helix domain-containing protein n=1 Tax=Acinetobacter wuhouensis TaxID=1879050 RepID=UPI00083AA112|nr:AraC family transcriptional regulator [Acinetobacter wuhouensis]AXQ20852.1 AraC family transcriptional regulator [Acinetobacter wuhouensis]